MTRVHVSDPADWADAFASEVNGIATCTFGRDIPADTEILVKGTPKRDEVERITGLQAVVVPFAGIPQSTRELLRDFPKVSLYNLHHNSLDTGEMAIALYFAVAKLIVPRDAGMRQGQWSSDSFLSSGWKPSEAIRASGKRALILGYGGIGQVIGQICSAMGMKVTAVRRKGPFDESVHPLSELGNLLPNADALFVALPLTPETKGLLNRERLALLPPRSIVVNIGRGPIIDDAALYEALKEGRLAGAGLDVWWKYPEGSDQPCFPSEFPFQDLPNVVMTPHVGGTSDASEEHRWRYLATVIEGIVDGTARPASVLDGY